VLGVNQSTVFRRIGQLEASLEARLFDRQPRGYALSAVGEEMLARAIRVEDDILALGRAVSGADQEMRGTIRIATIDEVLEPISPALAVFSARHPGIEFDLNTEQRIFSLTRREADVAIRPGLAPTEPDIVGRSLVELPIAAYAAPDYLRRAGRPEGIGDLAGHRLVDFPRGHVAAGQWTLGIEEVDVVFRANSMPGQAIAARSSVGIAFLPRFVGDPDPGLDRLFGVSADPQFHLWLLIHADLRQTARVRAFVDFMTESIQASRDLWEGRTSASR
jgi:DNA-binding transcriptional LysR family regulator